MSDQPLVSIVILAYKQEHFVREAVRSALAQTYGNLEIVLSDDASPDRTFEIMMEEAEGYSGPHKLILNRNPTNLGLAGNLNRAVQLSSGELIIEQDGDDISFPTRASRLVERWVSEHPRRALVYSRATRIGTDGSLLPRQNIPLPVATLEEVAAGKFYLAGGAVSSYSRLLFDKYGPVNPGVRFPDYVMTFRALLETGCSYIDEPLIYYRIHKDSITQIISKSRWTRSNAARRARHAVAEAEERLRAWDLAGKRDPKLRRKLARSLSYARLDERSSSGSRLAALGCCIRAIGTGRPNAAWTFLRRDVLNRNG